jgi:hypothetical protein
MPADKIHPITKTVISFPCFNMLHSKCDLKADCDKGCQCVCHSHKPRLIQRKQDKTIMRHSDAFTIR